MALCFGWIDSIIKSLDNLHTVRRFTPRQTKSSYSQTNKERLRWLSDNELLHPSITETVKPILKEKFEFPADIIKTIKANKKAWNNYQTFSPPFKRIRVAYIESGRKRPGEFEKRLANIIKVTEQNKQIGYGGIDKYF